SAEANVQPLFVEADGNRFEVVTVLEGRARILVSQNPAKFPHRIQAWGSLTPKELYDALSYYFSDSGYSTGLDLTTRDQAQIAAVVATGGQGPVRTNAKRNLQGITLIDGNGNKHYLKGEEAKM